jgi:uncharacterized protein
MAADTEAHDSWDTNLKVSRYVSRVDLTEAYTTLFFAGLGARLVEVPGAQKPMAQALLEDPNNPDIPVDPDLRKLFVDQAILVPEDCDEVSLLARRSHGVRYTPSSGLSLTICPTVDCNFRCPYCYQHHLPGGMPDEVQQATLRFIDEHQPEVTSLGVTWFGGEPLLGLSAIETLSGEFIERFGRENYHASMITNGLLLTPQVSTKLVDLGVARVQVTIDGPRESHNQRRICVDKKPTFDRIAENLRQADRGLGISVRVNVDQENLEALRDEFFDQLDETGLKGRISVYFAPVETYTEVCADVAGTCLAGRSWAKSAAQLQLKAYQRGYGGTGIPSSKANVCIADNVSGWVINHDGMVYKCWSDVTEPHKAVRNLLTEETTPAMRDNLVQWMNWSPFKLSGCQECKTLPQCMGGCPLMAFQQEGEIKKGHCSELRHNLRETVATYYLGIKEKQAMDQLTSSLHQVIPDLVPAASSGTPTK